MWLAVGLPRHPHHSAARSFWLEGANALVFCRVTALGLVRLLTNPLVTGGEDFSVARSWEAYDAFRALPEVGLLDEPGECEELLAEWARSGRFTKRHWTDAYLAAFAVSGGLRLVSFDAGFARFPGLQFLHLSSPDPSSRPAPPPPPAAGA